MIYGLTIAYAAVGPYLLKVRELGRPADALPATQALLPYLVQALPKAS